MKRPSKRRRLVGRIDAHPDGFAFLIPDNGDPHIFIPSRRLAGARHGDLVEVRLLVPKRSKDSKKKRPRHPGRASLEGEVIKIRSRSEKPLVGKVLRLKDGFYLSPFDLREGGIVRLIDFQESLLSEGVVAAAEVIGAVSRREPELARLLGVIGNPEDPDIELKVVCFRHGINPEFPDSVLAEAEHLQYPSQADLAGRQDLRDALVLTIDGQDAQDFDDALSIRRLDDGGFELAIHIADVSHYVESNSDIDQEARRRGTSVYFPERAVGMLPAKLSNDLCSLKPGEDRLALTVNLRYRPDAQLLRSRFVKSVIRSQKRFTYQEVYKILIEKDVTLCKENQKWIEPLTDMLELSRKLKAGRRKRGCIDFNLPEAKVVFSRDGDVAAIVAREQNQAHQLVEEFMLAANEVVATSLDKNEIPLIYRIHERPDPEQVSDFIALVQAMGIPFPMANPENLQPKDFQTFADHLVSRPDKRALSYRMLRSFMQARYSNQNLGHFGLASQSYTHFTSPIRRYPDLILHRLLKSNLLAGRTPHSPALQIVDLEEIASVASSREREAEAAERSMVRLAGVQLMKKYIGEEFPATVSDVRPNGLWAELEKFFLEGFVHVQTLEDDYYEFDELALSLRGKRSGRRFRLGDRLRVRVERVDTGRRSIGFSLVPD